MPLCRNVKRNLECFVYVPAIFILITIIISMSRDRSFISVALGRKREKKRGEKLARDRLNVRITTITSMLTSKRKNKRNIF